MDSPNESPLVRIDRDIVAAMRGMDAVHETIDSYWHSVDAADCCPMDGTWRALFNSAVAEIAGNIVRHAYEEPARDETFRMTLLCFPDRVEAILIDNGETFDFQPPSRSADMRDALDNFDLDHGWGLPIVLAATDSLRYEQLPNGSNRWILDKRLT